ncbi:MAG: hypothetical protein [Arizlama microvirus]|nr:MAG: hypothetical protein [Arizlama microvirus]
MAYRDTFQKSFTHWEGYYLCANCGQQHSYESNCWTRLRTQIQSDNKQLKLF